MTGRRILITGCSGGGKSTLIAELARRGHAVGEEPGRRVIAAERATSGDGLPWENPLRFATACLEMAERDWMRAGAGCTFFDRGVVDAAFALRRMRQPDLGMAALARCRYDHVFLAPPWRALFDADPDPDRQHGFAEAEAEYDDIADGLRGLGSAFIVAGIMSLAFVAFARLGT